MVDGRGTVKRVHNRIGVESYLTFEDTPGTPELQCEISPMSSQCYGYFEVADQNNSLEYLRYDREYRTYEYNPAV